MSALAVALRERLAGLKTDILAHMADYPDDVDGREELWMEREDIRAELQGPRTPFSMGAIFMMMLYAGQLPLGVFS